jgi:hypothetical protein
MYTPEKEKQLIMQLLEVRQNNAGEIPSNILRQPDMGVEEPFRAGHECIFGEEIV